MQNDTNEQVFQMSEEESNLAPKMELSAFDLVFFNKFLGKCQKNGIVEPGMEALKVNMFLVNSSAHQQNIVKFVMEHREKQKHKESEEAKNIESDQDITKEESNE